MTRGKLLQAKIKMFPRYSNSSYEKYYSELIHGWIAIFNYKLYIVWYTLEENAI